MSSVDLRPDHLLRDVVGGRTAKALATLDIQTVGELLEHYPRRYFSRGELTDLQTLVPGEYVTVMARVKSVRNSSFRNRSNGRMMDRTELVVTDGSGQLMLTFFGRKGLQRQLPPGRLGLFSGEVGEYRGKLQLVQPDFELLPDGTGDGFDAAATDFLGRMIAVYPATRGLPSPVIDRAVGMTLARLAPVADPLPGDVLDAEGLVPLDKAIRDIHRPVDHAAARAARRRLAFDEALVVQLALAQRRHRADRLSAVARPPRADGVLSEFDSRSPFVLTAGQTAVGDSLAERLAGTHPMHVLLQGDVGTGKTLVALRAMLQVVDTGGQAVLLAPTEVLAQQHYASIVGLLGDLAEGGLLGGSAVGTRVVLLTGSTPAAARRTALLDIVTGDAGIVVGTHALLQESVQYHDLGLIVVDEQHRFGVEQRSALLERVPDQRPHLLVMTATPIPRSVAMTVFGDLDVLSLTERPHGDPAIVSHVVSSEVTPTHVDRAWERVAEEVAAGRQVFVVCPRIGDDDTDVDVGDGPAPTHAVESLTAELSAGPLQDVRVGVMHGRLSPDEKEDVMRRFAAGPSDEENGLDVLVSTTVIEVGVDVPAAGMIVIMDADRFGVSQLHQLRGRVGRDGRPALCLLVTSARPGDPAHDRLVGVAASLDGFELSRLDLEQRREGDVLGTAQSGRRSSLRLLSVVKDEDLIAEARRTAARIIADDPDLVAHPLLAQAVADLEAQAATEYLDKS